jgi:prepilin-type processing-associated H-X9-DG protein
MRINRPSKYAFTLVELLVVVATVALLGCLIIPAFASAKIRSPAVGCLSNLRQLQIGWLMYKDDNNDVLMPGGPAGFPSNQVWCAGTESWGSTPGNTNRALYLGSLMAPYVSSNVTVFRCPGDVIPSANGTRLRSYSMNGQMGAVYGPPNYNPGWRQYTTASDLTCPAPKDAFVFLDEHPGSIDDAFFQESTTSPKFPNVPAAYLEGGCGFSFADGHAEIHKWKTPVLQLPVIQGVTVINTAPTADNADWIWLVEHTACNHF